MPPKLAFGVITVSFRITNWERLEMPMGNAYGIKIPIEDRGFRGGGECGRWFVIFPLSPSPPYGFFNLA